MQLAAIISPYACSMHYVIHSSWKRCIHFPVVSGSLAPAFQLPHRHGFVGPPEPATILHPLTPQHRPGGTQHQRTYEYTAACTPYKLRCNDESTGAGVWVRLGGPQICARFILELGMVPRDSIGSAFYFFHR